MDAFDVERWLAAHSDRVERRGGELRFVHATGETSLLVPRDERWGERDLLPAPAAAPLADFYGRFVGASIGDSQLTFATSIRGGLDVSHGFRLHDFEQMRAEAASLGVQVGARELPFLAEAAWMFVYTVEAKDGDCLVRAYDRDYGTVRFVPSLADVFEEWWKIVLAG